jgi:hypothetical protein
MAAAMSDQRQALGAAGRGRLGVSAGASIRAHRERVSAQNIQGDCGPPP